MADATNIPLINGVRHSWASGEFNWLGRTVTGIMEISWKIKRDKKDFFGSGDEVKHRGRGNKSYELKIKLAKYEVDAAEDLLLEDQDLTDIDISNFSLAWKPTGMDTLKRKAFDFVEVTEYALSAKQGDMELSYDITMIVGKIRSPK